MKNLRKLFIFVFVLISILFINGCAKITFSLPTYNIELTVGETYEVKPIIENLENPEFIFKNENDSIKIDGNIITAVKKGGATVIISIKDHEDVGTQTLYIKVKNVDPENIATVDDISLMVGETYDIAYTIYPVEALPEVTFESKDSSVANVIDGKVTALKPGKTTIIVTVKEESVTITKNISVEVRGTDLPVVSFGDGYKKDIVINWGTKIDYLAGITVADIEDGDITDNLKVENKIDTQQYGKHIVKYSVSDSDGNTTTFERNIEVVWNYDVQFIGHAGSYYGIMNTEEAIRYAIETLKYQAVEVDLKQSKDGVFILCHDDTWGGKILASTNWNELKDVEVTQSRNAGFPAETGTNSPYTSKLCTLEKYLQICKENNVTAVIELKSSNGITNSNQSRMQALMDEIEKANMLENVIFLGSQYNCLIWTRNNGYEYIPCQYLVNSCESETYLQRCIDYDLDISINVTGNHSNSEEWLARYKEKDIEISTYTYTQYVNYDVVQEWINKGVDYVTCDWHRMDKLILPVSSNEPAKTFNVKFMDLDGTVLKETNVKQGKYAPAPKVTARKGYEFIGWDKELGNIQADTIFTAQYKAIEYTITYVANLDVVTESTWATKEEFASDFYNDLFDWIRSKGTEIEGLKIDGETYSLTRNGVTVKFKNGSDIKALYVYDVEKTISNILYKPVTRNSDGTCVIYEDDNYFLNSNKYRIKYQGMDQWLYNCIKQSYSTYDTTYKVLSSGKIQIFFRMHQWMNGTKIAAFDNYPVKYDVVKDTIVKPVLPTTPLFYTVLDEVKLPEATGNVKFLGWYLSADYTGEAITTLPIGTTGNIILYAKWEK